MILWLDYQLFSLNIHQDYNNHDDEISKLGLLCWNVQLLDLANWAGVLEKLLQIFETSSSKSSKSSTFQHFQQV